MGWHVAGPAATREQLQSAGFEVVDAWGPQDSLPGEAASSDGVDEDDESAWTVFVGRLTRRPTARSSRERFSPPGRNPHP